MSDRRRLVAILNPQADRGRTGQLADELQEQLRGRLDISLLKTTRRGEATELAAQAASDGCDAVVAIGGDGTVHEVANGLMAAAARPPLAIVPAGSGNDVAFALGITKDRVQTLRILESGAPRAIDIGRGQTAGGRSAYCVNNIGLLLEGEINLASHQVTWPRGSGLYVRAMLQSLLRRLPTADLELTVDGTRLSRRAMMFSMANGPRSGGKFRLAEDATIDDGYFDYVLGAPVSRMRLLWKAALAMRGAPLRGSWIEHGRFKTLTLKSNAPLVGHVDGEPWLRPGEGEHELFVEVLPRALEVLCPKVDKAGTAPI